MSQQIADCDITPERLAKLVALTWHNNGGTCDQFAIWYTNIWKYLDELELEESKCNI